jgi:hypothetical protein
MVISARVGGLGLAALDEYLADMRAWVLGNCRVALAAGTASGRIGEKPGAMLDALIAAGGTATGDLERFLRYDAKAPHVALARQFGFSGPATALIVLAAAPQLWGDFAQLYKMIGFTGRAIVEERLLAALLNMDRATIAAEIDPGAPLAVTGVCKLGCGTRPNAPLIVHPLVVRRLAGEKFHDVYSPHGGRPVGRDHRAARSDARR